MPLHPWVLDLDGVMWRGDTPIPGSAEAVDRLAEAGVRVGYCTNNSSERVGFYEEKLARLGVRGDVAGAVISSAMAAASLLGAGERVLLCAGDGAREAAECVGAHVVAPDSADGGVDTVLVGFHRSFDYAAMRAAVRAVLGGARLIATNDDPIYPAADGPAPGCGSILASIERGSGVSAIVAGKPQGTMADLVRERFGTDGVFVGDSLHTDGAMAAELNWPFGLVLSGNVGAEAVPANQPKEWVARDLAELVDRYLRQ